MASATQQQPSPPAGTEVSSILEVFAEIERQAVDDPSRAFLSVQRHLGARTVALFCGQPWTEETLADCVWLNISGHGANGVLRFTDRISSAGPLLRMLAGFAEYKGNIVGVIVPADVGSELTRRPVSVGALSGVEFCRLDLEMPSTHLVGTELAEPAFLEIASDQWLLVSAVILGVARASLNYVLDYSRRRITFGKPICQHQAVSLRLADIMIAMESASLLCRDMCRSTDGDRSRFEGAQGCWRYVREMAVALGPEMLQLMGGHGFLRMHPVEQWYRDLQFLCLYGDLPEAIEEEP